MVTQTLTIYLFVLFLLTSENKFSEMQLSPHVWNYVISIKRGKTFHIGKFGIILKLNFSVNFNMQCDALILFESH